MLTAIETAQSPATAAVRLASDNFRANLSALASFHPGLPALLPGNDTHPTWLFARDGYLTTRSETAAWLSGCSIPLRTAHRLLQKLELTGTLGCFLNPNHPAQIRVALEKIQPIQAIVAVIPYLRNLHTFLHCEDFSPDIRAARLFFVAGPDWPDQLAALFEKFPGLPLPQQFIRTSLLDDSEMADLSSEAQRIISHETSRRSEKMPEILIRAQSQKRSGRTIILAGSRFNLADLSNIALRHALLDGDPSFIAFDPDHPLTAGPLALAEAAAESDALVTADLCRADLPNVVSEKTAWIAWITTGRIVAPDTNAPRDAILLADPAWRPAAIDAGWPATRIHIAGWPQIIPASLTATAAPILGLLTDTRSIEIPQKVKDFSSQLLLWEYVEDELSRDPLALGDDPDRYLNTRMARFNLHDEGFERPLFIERLIAPAYKRGLALLLLKNGIRLSLFGRGWTEIPELKSHATGPIEDLPALSRAISQCRAVLQPLPDRTTQAGLPVPTIRTVGLHPARLLGRIRETLAAKSPVRDNPTSLNRDLIAFLLNAVVEVPVSK